jgi:hypothetical protein
MTAAPLRLFLLEHNYGQATEADLARMYRALTRAVTRLSRAAPPPLRIVSAVFVPDDNRCLYLVEAAVADLVTEATDIAGLSNGTIRPVVSLDDMSLRPNSASANDRTLTER